MRWPLAVEELPSASRRTADLFVEALRRADGESVGSHSERLREALEPLIIAAYDNADARLADLAALTGAARNATRLSDVAADLTLEPPNSTGDLAGPPSIDEDWLVISTVHSAKGLEFPIVFVAALQKGVETKLPVIAFSRNLGLGARWRVPGTRKDKDDLWQHAIRPIALLRGQDRQPARSALLDATR